MINYIAICCHEKVTPNWLQKLCVVIEIIDMFLQHIVLLVICCFQQSSNLCIRIQYHSPTATDRIIVLHIDHAFDYFTIFFNHSEIKATLEIALE